jgi:tetratricopeptide (TPR) repeat protein
MTIKLFVSSTRADMQVTYRPAILNLIRGLEGFEIVAMEHFGSWDESGTTVSVQKTAESDVYLGIVGWRYGYVPNTDERSVTWREYDMASQLQRPRLLFLAADTPAARASFPAGSLDTIGDSPEAARQLRHLLAFRTMLNERHANTEFSSVADLVSAVSSSLNRVLLGGTEGDMHFRRGWAALERGDYASARSQLERSVRLYREDANRREAARARFALVLAEFGGERPFIQTLQTMREVENLLTVAIQLHPSRSYLLALALFKLDFARNGLPQLLDEAQQLLRQAEGIAADDDDDDNMRLLRLCQPTLVEDHVIR